ncbi:hypothetical protein Pcinc_017408 [Petrolisthes cinctipes]|uniref:Regulatory protein zeste n=1 Tax=Petrolisthes cinctipes TaxID=88211 RepID=A0AAE1FQU2_PETCI|nr:hypothetical protein Pcinc_017408 [Petrolisthes cinctipes]
MDGQGKNRQAPVSSQGISLLIDIVGQHPVVCDRRSDARIVAVKNEAWENIAAAFNATGVGGQPRTAKQLKKIWDRIKSNTKEEHVKVKPELKKTGGGPQPTPYPDETSKVLDLVRGELFDTTNSFDSNNASTYSLKDSTGVPLLEVEEFGLEVISTQGVDGNGASDMSLNDSYANAPPAKKLRRAFKYDSKEKENWKPLKMSAEQYREAFDIEKKILRNRLEEAHLRKDTEKYKN